MKPTRVVRSEVEDGSTKRRVKYLTLLTEPQGKIKKPQGKIKKMRLNNGIRLTWLGHSTFKIETDGQTLLIDPWVTNNPVCPDALKNL